MGSGGQLLTRWRLTRFGLVVSAAAVAAATVAVAAWPHAWPWVVLAGGITAAVAPVALSGLTAAHQRRVETARAVRQGLQSTMGSAGDVLPLAVEANLDARVHRAVLELPYIHRDAEDEVRTHLKAGRPVLLVGSSMVGKTRMSATLIRGMFPTRKVVIPDTKESLPSLDAGDVLVREAVIFLDDIDRLVGQDGITDGALHRLMAAGNIIIGTIRAGVYDRFKPTDRLRPPEWDVLSSFERIFITRELSNAEQQRLAEAVSDSGVRKRIEQIGLGEYAGAAEHIADALRLGASVNPPGFALVLGAADWQRAGMSAPVPTQALRDLAVPHLHTRHPVDLSNDEAYQAALTWATRDINPTVALLQHAGAEAFEVYDYAFDLLSEQAQPIPEAIWPVLIHYATRPELAVMASLATYRGVVGRDRAELSRGIDFFRQAIAATPTDDASRTRYETLLGVALSARYELIRVIDDLNDSITVLRSAVKATPALDSESQQRLSLLGRGLISRYSRVSEISDLNEAAQCFREAVKTIRSVDPDRLEVLADLVNILWVRFKKLGDMADLDEAIRVGREAIVGASQLDEHARKWLLSNLEAALQERFERYGKQTDLDEAIRLRRKAGQAAAGN